jgi:hypothetical protein
MFLGLTGGRAGGYSLIGACIDAGDEVARQENENGVCMGVSGCRQLRCRISGGITECLIGQPIEVKSMGGRIPAVVVIISWLVCP